MTDLEGSVARFHQTLAGNVGRPQTLISDDPDYWSMVRKMPSAQPRQGPFLLAARESVAAWTPEQKPDLCILLDRSPSMEIWGDLTGSVSDIFKSQGCWNRVSTLQLDTGSEAPALSGDIPTYRQKNPLAVVVVTDTLGQAWQNGEAFELLKKLGDSFSVSIAHLFPSDMQKRTSLASATRRPLISSKAGASNQEMAVRERTMRSYKGRFPIFNLTAGHLRTYENFMSTAEGNSIQGILIPEKNAEKPTPSSTIETPEEAYENFLRDASPEARKLVEIFAAIPLRLDVMRKAQARFLPDSHYWHLAEVFFSGLVEKSPLSPEGASPQEAWYTFKPGVRDLILNNSNARQTIDVWRAVGDMFPHRRYGFNEILEGTATLSNEQQYLAEVDAAVMRTWGGEYATLVSTLETALGKSQG
jgi:hypothetical protein